MSTEAYEDKYGMMPAEELDSMVSRLAERIAQSNEINAELKANPRKALREMKEAQLKGVLEQYAKISTEDSIERIAINLATNQAFEKQIRHDIKQLGESEEVEKQLKKQLEIAKRVLSEKNKPGGRQ